MFNNGKNPFRLQHPIDFFCQRSAILRRHVVKYSGGGNKSKYHRERAAYSRQPAIGHPCPQVTQSFPPKDRNRLQNRTRVEGYVGGDPFPQPTSRYLMLRCIKLSAAKVVENKLCFACLEKFRIWARKFIANGILEQVGVGLRILIKFSLAHHVLCWSPRSGPRRPRVRGH